MIDQLTLPKGAMKDFTRLIELQERQLRELVVLMKGIEAVSRPESKFTEIVVRQLQVAYEVARSLLLVSNFLIETVRDVYLGDRIIDSIKDLPDT